MRSCSGTRCSLGRAARTSASSPSLRWRRRGPSPSIASVVTSPRRARCCSNRRASRAGRSTSRSTAASSRSGARAGTSRRGTRRLGWDLEVGPSRCAPIMHLPKVALYEAPLPSSKLVTPLADGRVSGTVRVDRGDGSASRGVGGLRLAGDDRAQLGPRARAPLRVGPLQLVGRRRRPHLRGGQRARPHGPDALSDGHRGVRSLEGAPAGTSTRGSCSGRTAAQSR